MNKRKILIYIYPWKLNKKIRHNYPIFLSKISAHLSHRYYKIL